MPPNSNIESIPFEYVKEKPHFKLEYNLRKEKFVAVVNGIDCLTQDYKKIILSDHLDSHTHLTTINMEVTGKKITYGHAVTIKHQHVNTFDIACYIYDVDFQLKPITTIKKRKKRTLGVKTGTKKRTVTTDRSLSEEDHRRLFAYVNRKGFEGFNGMYAAIVNDRKKETDAKKIPTINDRKKETSARKIPSENPKRKGKLDIKFPDLLLPWG